MNKPLNILLLLSAILPFCFISCKKDQDTGMLTENYKGIFVVNEGGFNQSNGSIGLFKPGDKSYFDAFKKANDRPLGDIVQSMVRIDDKYFIVVNNSNKIEVVGVNDFKSISTINSNSPRYVLPVSSGKAYLSNLYNNTIKILNTGSLNVSSTIDIHHNSENMVMLDSNAYISTPDNIIMVVNTKTDGLSDSIVTAAGLSRMVNAWSNKIAILCTGRVDWSTGSVLENGKIQIINKDSNALEKSFSLSSGSFGGSIIYSSSTASIYFSLGNNVIYRMTLDGVISEFKTLEAGRSVYGLSYNKSTAEIFVTDAGDFNSAGKVIVYDLSGSKKQEFSAGVAPNGVLIND